MDYFVVLWFILTIIFVVNMHSLLLSLIILEMFGFMLLLGFSMMFVSSSDFICLSLFSFFVMEGVIGLSGLISLVLFTGSDSISVSSMMKQ